MNLILVLLAASNTSGPCGDPAVLTVSSPALQLLVGEKVVLTTFGSREDRPLRYEWRVVSAPDGSSQQIAQPTGTTFERTKNCQHVYVDGTVPAFTPDRPGQYQLELSAIDVATGERALATKTLEVGFVRHEDSGCSSAPVVALLALGSWWRRRQSRVPGDSRPS